MVRDTAPARSMSLRSQRLRKARAILCLQPAIKSLTTTQTFPIDTPKHFTYAPLRVTRKLGSIPLQIWLPMLFPSSSINGSSVVHTLRLQHPTKQRYRSLSRLKAHAKNPLFRHILHIIISFTSSPPFANKLRNVASSNVFRQAGCVTLSSATGGTVPFLLYVASGRSQSTFGRNLDMASISVSRV